jgi:hypothetical protein
VEGGLDRVFKECFWEAMMQHFALERGQRIFLD